MLSASTANTVAGVLAMNIGVTNVVVYTRTVIIIISTPTATATDQISIVFIVAVRVTCMIIVGSRRQGVIVHMNAAIINSATATAIMARMTALRTGVLTMMCKMRMRGVPLMITLRTVMAIAPTAMAGIIVARSTRATVHA